MPENCSMRWENRISCELRRGHVGVHTNQRIGLQWWGQVLFDPVPGSLADRQSDNLDDPEVRPIRPDWADETEALLLATWGDHAPQRLPPISVSPQAIPVQTSVARPLNRPIPAYQPVQRPNGQGRIVAPHPGSLVCSGGRLRHPSGCACRRSLRCLRLREFCRRVRGARPCLLLVIAVPCRPRPLNSQDRHSPPVCSS